MSNENGNGGWLKSVANKVGPPAATIVLSTGAAFTIVDLKLSALDRLLEERKQVVDAKFVTAAEEDGRLSGRLSTHEQEVTNSVRSIVQHESDIKYLNTAIREQLTDNKDDIKEVKEMVRDLNTKFDTYILKTGAD